MKHLIQSLCMALLVLLFVYAALSKLLDAETFRGQLYNQVFPHAVADMLFYALPLAELATAALLLFTRTQTAGLHLSLVLLTLFTGYIGLTLLHFWSRVPCSCGGILSQLSWGGHLAFNITFILINIAALLLYRHERGKPKTFEKSRHII